MIQVRIRLYEIQGLWKLYELNVSGPSVSVDVYNHAEAYASKEEAVTIAQYEARRTIAKAWNTAVSQEIAWDIQMIANPLPHKCPACGGPTTLLAHSDGTIAEALSWRCAHCNRLLCC